MARTQVSVASPVWDTWIAQIGPMRGVVPYRRAGRFRGGVVRRLVVPSGVPSLSVKALLGGLGLRQDGGVRGTWGKDRGGGAHGVRKLFFGGGFTGTLLKERIDPEDFLQEVYRGLITRNNGTCPWDKSKSSFGHYVHIVMRCILSNYLRKDRRRTSVEEVTSDGTIKGVAGGDADGGEDFSRRDLLRGIFPSDFELERSLEVVSLMETGKSRKEVAALLEMAVDEVDGVLRAIRQGIRG